MGNNSTRFLYCCLLIQILIPLQAQVPILGAVYGSLREKYEKVPPDLMPRCAHLGRKVSHFGYCARYASDGAEYYAVLDMGTRVDSDAYGYGWIILVHGSSCSEGDLDWAMRGMLPSKGYQGVGPTVEMPGLNAPEVGIPPEGGYVHYVIRSAREEEVLRGLIRDAIQRAIKINGGDAIVRKVLCRPQNVAPDAEYPLVALELSRYCAVTRPSGMRE
jgi:hypothetical protein